MKKLLYFFFLLIIGVFSIVNISYAYQRVNGYTRKDGTYVAPYVRSNPNGLKYDNYSYTPSQGLYNITYGTRGSYWDTPTYITDPEYYTGKSIYESNKTGGSYTTVTSPSINIINTNPTPTTISKTVVCGVNEYLSSYSKKCNCNSGFKKDESGICQKITCGQNENLNTYNNTCYCKTGYKKNTYGNCEQVVCGLNESLNTYNNTCYCKTGYKKSSDGICRQVICGANESLNTYNSTCYCNTGYKKNYTTGQCESSSY